MIRNCVVIAALALAGCTMDGVSATPADVRPTPSDGLVCIGLPRQVCEMAAGGVGYQRGDPVPALITIRCMSATCDEDAGEARSEILFVDGTRRSDATLTWGMTPLGGQDEPPSGTAP